MLSVLEVSITAKICECANLLVSSIIDVLFVLLPSYNDVSRNQKVRIRAEAFEGSGVSPKFQEAFVFLSGGQDVEYIEVPVIPPPGVPFPQILSEQDIEEDFPENRADSDFFTFYWFAVVYPIAALLTIAHLILHGIPVLGFIVSLTVSYQF